jgi:hypothetical protein
LEELNVLTTPDAPDNLLPISGGMCGSGLYPTNFAGTKQIVPNVGAPFEWAPASGGPASPVLGRVIYTNKDREKDDIPWDHPFGYDYWFNLAPADSRYLPLLSSSELPSADCPVGAYPQPGQSLPEACRQTDLEVRPNHDADACEALCIERANHLIPVGSLHTEIEGGLIPEAYLPDANDWVYMRGHHIVDCGHDNFGSEIHPPTILVKAHSNQQTGLVRSTLIVAPYFTNQFYTGASDFLIRGRKTFWDQMMALITMNAMGPVNLVPGLYAPLEVLPSIDNTPFTQRIVARYTVALAPSPGKTAASVRYHFEIRPGVSIQVSRPNQTQAQVEVVLDPNTYVPLSSPKCTKVHYSFDTIDARAKWPSGASRALTNSVLPLIPGLPPPSIALTAALNEGLIMYECAVPGEVPRNPGPVEEVADNQVNVNLGIAYPAYGWLDLEWDNSQMALTVNRIGNGTVGGPGIDCGVTCASSVLKGKNVTLTAKPGAGWAFSTWVGDCAGIPACSVIMDKPQTVTAVFVQPSLPVHKQHALSILVTDSTGPGCQIGTGTVTTTPSSLACTKSGNLAAFCTTQFDEGASVKVNESVGEATSFANFSGDCSGQSCEVTMDADRRVVAELCGLIH